MVKKDKAKKAEKKARTAQKQEKKADKKDKKQKSRGNKQQDDDSDAEDADLDAILAQYAKEQEQFLKVTEETSEPPSPRASATVLGSPANENELFIFGGEYFNGSLAHFYNDLFVYNINRDDWKKVTSPNSPLPRSGHAWCRGGNAGGIYLFGGEFSSPKQGTFYHYNDFWRLDPASREWSKVEGRSRASGPPARSGHRMTFYKNYIILFGGFQDTSQTRYMNDLWIYDTSTYSWHEPKLPAGTRKPDARSSFSFLPHESGAVLYGGYSRVKATAGSGHKQVKGGSRPGAQRVVLKPVVHQDCWFLRITAPPSDAPSGSLPSVKWEIRKRPANAPNPARAGATMCSHKGRGIMFGGVHDVEESEEGIDSEFFDTLFAWNIDRNRYFQLTLRRPKTGTKKAAPERNRRERGKQNEEELLRNLKALEMGHSISDVTHEEPVAVPDEAENAEEKPAKVVTFEMPHPRFNAQLSVQGDTLFIFGGTFEKGDQEFTMDEMFAIDLNKLDGVKEIYKRDLQGWQAEEESDEEDEMDMDEDEDYSGSERGSEDDQSTIAVSVNQSTAPSSIIAEDEVIEVETSAMSDDFPHPRPFEVLRDFYERSRIQWQELIIAEFDKSGQSMHMTAKEISAKGFHLAEEKWWDCREEVRALEDEQTEAGIGEVVSLADKQAANAGAGRRR